MISMLITPLSIQITLSLGPLLKGPDDWTPYNSHLKFEVADFLYRRNQMSAGDINCLLTLWAASLAIHNDKPPFANATQMYNTINSSPLGSVPWESFSLQYNRVHPECDILSWMEANYDVWFWNPRTLVHNMLSNPDFESDFDYAPFQEHTADGIHCFCDFMSGNWAWRQVDLIAEDLKTHGSVFCPIILGSDKTTVSVAMGHNEYWPLYLSITHRNGVVLLGFFTIPQTTHECCNDASFHKFRRQLLHLSIAKILKPLKPGMTTLEVVRFPDYHFRRVIYGLGPYIADYPEQVLLACIVQGWCAKCTVPANDLNSGQHVCRSQEHSELLVEEFELGMLWDEYGLVGDVVPFTHHFPCADIHQLLSPDLLHQLIKGCFKDHLIMWVNNYIKAEHSASKAQKIFDDIDWCIALAPPFVGLRRFPKGRNFKQWTGNDSKALMKVYLPAIQGHVPDEMHREIFRKCGIRESFNLPRQHSLIHYNKLICAYGAPNGLCSSITESKHIKAVKEPWWHSNHYDALSQMLLTNQCLDVLVASCVDFANRGMLKSTPLSSALDLLTWILHKPQDEPSQLVNQDSSIFLGNNDGAGDDTGRGSMNEVEGDDDGDGDIAGPTVEAHVDLAKVPLCTVYPDDVATKITQPNFPYLIQLLICDQEHPDLNSDTIHSTTLPIFYGKIIVYPSAVATFHAPSDISGTGGMHCEHIRSVCSWRHGPGRYDTIFVNTDSAAEGMLGLDVACVRLFFSFSFEGTYYPCALVHWFACKGDSPDDITGMWIVEPYTLEDDDEPFATVIHLDTIL
ncbi:hypothetical protein BJY52DRAFT_1202845 [Lactarius psammicola]|nr:hypothetical protein BJY52DRAFT_1202845 [Lactarius psammicola]